MDFGAVFKKARLIAGLTQENLAEKLRISRENVSRIENERLEPRITDAIRWGQATQAPELIAAMLCGVDASTILQNITQILGGFIAWIF